MPRTLYDLTENVIQQRLKIRCLGSGREYLPWFNIHDVPSNSRSWRVKGWRHNRIHQLLSDGEYHAFLCFEKAKSIDEIQEQFRLKRETTIAIAEKLGIKHPVYRSTGATFVLTTDFLLFVKKGNRIIRVARTYKPKQELNDEGYERMLEKFEIERIYWEMEGVDWAIITEEELPPCLYTNMKELHSLKTIKLSEYSFNKLQMQQAIDLLSQRVARDNSTPLSITTSEVDNQLGIEPGSSLTIAKHLIINDIWDFDLRNILLDPFIPLPISVNNF